MSATLKWNAEKIKKAVKSELMENAPVVGKYVEVDARKRLHAIVDPTWGENYRKKVVSRMLTNVVDEQENEIDITVGVGKTAKSRHHGFYIELGSATAKSHPFLRPAVFNNAKNIIALLVGD